VWPAAVVLYIGPSVFTDVMLRLLARRHRLPSQSRTQPGGGVTPREAVVILGAYVQPIALSEETA